MAFRIEVTEPAESDMEEAATYIARDSATKALKWTRDLWKIIFSLSELPARHAIIPEAASLGYPYRSALHHSHRVIFKIDESAGIVYILRIYHGARKPLSSRDFT